MKDDQHAAPAVGPALTFWGAAGSVSGSMHVLDWNNRRILLDCGLNQGRRDESRERNNHFPFNPADVDAVIISHAHIDHCGNLPTLVKQGFRGPVYCTPPTQDLLRVMLEDSAKIQEEDAAHINIQRNYREPWAQPLYAIRDVERALGQVESIPYGKPFSIADVAEAKFAEAGHIIGSALVHLQGDSANGDCSLCFSGDLGRRGLPMLKQAGNIPAATVLVCESTYGNRTHPSFEQTVDKLYEAVRRTVERGGKVLIPAFSLGRTQLIVHILQEGLRKGLIPKVPIAVDSPLAGRVAEVYRMHPNALQADVGEAVKEGHGILGGDGIVYTETVEESLSFSAKAGSSIIIASSGMCDAGRIQGHLRHHIDDPRCTVILVSYQASGTVGRRLLEPTPTVRMMNKDWNKWIEVVHLDGFSGHADRNDFLAYLNPLVGRVQKIRLIHGEREQAEALADMLRNRGFDDVEVPNPGDQVELF